MRRHIDLFSGIGGFSLAARANGVTTVQFCEIDPRCRAFLARAWPGIPIHDDVRTLGLADAGLIECGEDESRRGPDRGAAAGWLGAPVWLLTAGVPCQPASRAGKQRGSADDRWLWPEALRLLRHYQPTWALFENPPGIGDVGLAGILAQVEAEGYEVRVHSVPACAVGAPHRRERYWIVAHTEESHAVRTGGAVCGEERGPVADLHGIDGGAACDGIVADASGQGCEERDLQPGIRGDAESGNARQAIDVGREVDLADPDQDGSGGGWSDRDAVPDANAEGLGHAEGSGGRTGSGEGKPEQHGPCIAGASAWADFIWLSCADGKVRRAPGDAVGLVDGLHRSVLGALGNSIVPQVAEVLIRAMVEAENETR